MKNYILFNSLHVSHVFLTFCHFSFVVAHGRRGEYHFLIILKFAYISTVGKCYSLVALLLFNWAYDIGMHYMYMYMYSDLAI